MHLNKLPPTIQVGKSFPDLSVALVVSSGCITVGHGPTVKVIPELSPRDRVPGVDSHHSCALGVVSLGFVGLCCVFSNMIIEMAEHLLRPNSEFC